jgi:5-hydroxyisourate hydrolase-like protein (transthyretin family)
MNPTRSRRKRVLLPTLISGLLLLLAVPAAHAGTFVHHSCGTQTGSAQGWTGSGTHSNVYIDRVCGGSSGYVGVHFGTGQGPWAPGAGGTVAYEAPRDLRVANWSYRMLGDYFGENGLGTYSGQIVWYARTADSALEHRPFNGSNIFAGYRSWNVDTDRVDLKVFCWDETPAPGCGQPHPHLEAPYMRFYENYVTLGDASDPAVESVSGALASGDAHRGTEELEADVTDTGSGIYRTIVTVDGSVVSRSTIDTNGGDCVDVNPSNEVYEFADNTPCRLSKRVAARLDTTPLSEGNHDVRVQVEDASGNATTVFHDARFRVDNVPPPANVVRPWIVGSAQDGRALTAEPGSWIGSGITFAYQWLRCDADGASCAEIGIGDSQVYVARAADVGRRLRVRVTASNAEGSTDVLSLPSSPVASASSTGGLTDRDTGSGSGPAGGALDRGAPNGHGASDRARLSAFTRNRQRRIKSRFGRTVVLTGRLVDEHGRPIAGAEIEVLSTLRRAAATSARLGAVKTDADGRYSYQLRATASRTVRFAYRSHLGDDEFADTSDVEVLVSGAARIKVSRRRVANKQKVTFSGRLRGEPPARGIVVVLQARVGNKWQTFAHTRTRRGGRFKKSYRFLRTYSTQTYAFRARLLRDSTWAYEPGFSNKVKVRVSGR